MSENKALAVQHNKLVEARYNLTLQEKRLVLWLISQIQPHDKEFKTYRVSIKELAGLIGIEKNKNLYKEMAELTGKLRSRPVDITEQDGTILVQTTWLNSAKYYFGQGYVELGFSSLLTPYLLQLKGNFTKLELVAALSLSSIYAVRIYELLKQYEKLGFRTMSMVDLRKRLGIADSEYVKYSHFKSRIIDIAYREINQKTDIRFEYTEIKEGRKITQFRFDIYPNNPPGLKALSDMVEPGVPSRTPTAAPIDIPADLLNKLRYFGIGRPKIAELAQTYGLEAIQAKLQDFEAAIDAGKEIAHPAGWLLSAIEKDWNYKSPFQLEQEQKEREELERQEQERQAAADRAKREAERKAKRSEFDLAIRELFLSRWTVLPPVAQAAIVAQANFNEAENRSYSKNGVEKSPVAMPKLQKLLLSEHELNFDKWLEAQTA